MDDEKNFYQEMNKLLPHQLETAHKVIENLLESKNKDRLTNQAYQKEFKNIKCPKCGDSKIKKNGHKNGTQRYICKKCKKSFSITTNTILQQTKLSYYQLRAIIQGIIDLNTINVISAKSKLSQPQTYCIVIRIFSTLKEIYEETKLKDIVQVDEEYFRISFKGTKKEKMPRISRHSGTQYLTSGISKDQICIIVAIDSYDNIKIEIAGLGQASTEMIKNVLDGKIEEKSILVTDSKSSYVLFAKDNNLILKQIPSGEHNIENYSLGELNSLMNEIETYVIHLKKGVSTKHLPQYLYFIKYRKVLKYTLEYLERNEKMYTEVVISTTNLKCRDVFKIEFPFNIEEYVQWWDDNH